MNEYHSHPIVVVLILMSVFSVYWLGFRGAKKIKSI